MPFSPMSQKYYRWKNNINTNLKEGEFLCCSYSAWSSPFTFLPSLSEGAVKPWSLVLRGSHEAIQVEDGRSQAGEQGVIITPASSGQQELTIHLG